MKIDKTLTESVTEILLWGYDCCPDDKKRLTKAVEDVLRKYFSTIAKGKQKT